MPRSIHSGKPMLTKGRVTNSWAAQIPKRVVGELILKTAVLGWAVLLILAFASSGWCGGEKIGPDQSTASLQETLDWLRDRVPEFGTFTFDAYDAQDYLSNGKPPVTLRVGRPSIDSQTFSWVEIDSCRLRYKKTDEHFYEPGVEPPQLPPWV